MSELGVHHLPVVGAGGVGGVLSAADIMRQLQADPIETQRLLTTVADAIARRLYHLGVDKLGPPPVPFAFVAYGSQARGEMGPASDQDNGIVLDNRFDPARHGDYFAALSKFVCEGLDSAGQVLCPGDVMAAN